MSIFPFLHIPDEMDSNQNVLPEYKEYAYDFSNNCLLKKGGKYYLLTGNEALKIWIYKALKTKRFVYDAYTSNFGTDIDLVLGQSAERGILESEIKRHVTETVMVNPYIQELSDFMYDWVRDGCKVFFEVTSIYDKFTWDSEVYVT